MGRLSTKNEHVAEHRVHQACVSSASGVRAPKTHKHLQKVRHTHRACGYTNSSVVTARDLMIRVVRENGKPSVPDIIGHRSTGRALKA